MRLQSEVDIQVKWLKDNRNNIPAYDAFGGDNHAKIDAEIFTLEEKLDEDDVYNKSNAEGEEDDSKEWNSEQLESALGVIEWREGNEDVSPMDNWGVLVKK